MTDTLTNILLTYSYSVAYLISGCGPRTLGFDFMWPSSNGLGALYNINH